MDLRWISALALAAACATDPEKPDGAGDGAEDPGPPADTDTSEDTDRDGDGHPQGVDCDDADPAVYPGAEELCNDRDDDCDDVIDEGVLLTFWADTDGDGHGDPTAPTSACAPPEGYAETDDDCDDTDVDVSPSAEEVCNGQDDDCDDVIDEDVTTTVYLDADGDGWGDTDHPTTGCPDTSGYAEQDGDCDDDDNLVHPGMITDTCDGVDSDCDGDTDEDSKAGWTLLSVDTADDRVYAIDPTNASLSVITTLGFSLGVNSMDVSENGVSIVHSQTDPASIQFFDACTGTLARIGPHGTSGLGGIAFGPSGRLFGIGSNDTLWEFDLGTGAATAVGPLGIDIGNSGLAWDCTNQRMFGADGSGNRVFEVDLTTGAATNVRPTRVPFSSVGLEFDRLSGLLYASTRTELYTIDPATGGSTYVGPLAAGNIDDLAWHPTCP